MRAEYGAAARRNPSSTGSEINLEADEWRVLTMVNAKNTVAQIAQRSGLGEMRACEIIAQLLASGLVQKREINLAEALFPELDRIATAAFGVSGQALLHDSYVRANIRDQSAAAPEQISAALDTFEGSSPCLRPGALGASVACPAQPCAAGAQQSLTHVVVCSLCRMLVRDFAPA